MVCCSHLATVADTKSVVKNPPPPPVLFSSMYMQFTAFTSEEKEEAEELLTEIVLSGKRGAGVFP
jgi:hypothetical protein